jgi:hypothetical protein
MSFAKTTVLAMTVVGFFGAASSARSSVPLVLPRVTIGHYNGNTGVNLLQWDLTNGDVPAATVAGAPPAPTVFGPLVGNADNAKCVVGDTWGPILVNTGICGVGPGVAVVRLKTTVFNGPTITPPGCTSEILITGNTLGSLTVNHSGGSINIPNQTIPTSALGAPWAAQVTQRGPGGYKLSSALYGVVDACF